MMHPPTSLSAPFFFSRRRAPLLLLLSLAVASFALVIVVNHASALRDAEEELSPSPPRKLRSEAMLRSEIFRSNLQQYALPALQSYEDATATDQVLPVSMEGEEPNPSREDSMEDNRDEDDREGEAWEDENHEDVTHEEQSNENQNNENVAYEEYGRENETHEGENGEDAPPMDENDEGENTGNESTEVEDNEDESHDVQNIEDETREEVNEENEVQEEDNTPEGIERGSVSVSFKTEIYNLEYFHCGPKPDDGGSEGTPEILLVDGKQAISKEIWYTSEIMQKLCRENLLSVTVIDEPKVSHSVGAIKEEVASDALRVSSALEGLAKGGVISGRPLTVVTPSLASYGIIRLAEEVEFRKQSAHWKLDNVLARLVKGWVPVGACSYVSRTRTSLREFREAEIPVLAVYGSADAEARQEADRMKQFIPSKRDAQLGSQSACYLDDPDAFVDTLTSFVNEI